jgi:hypothetical protein
VLYSLRQSTIKALTPAACQRSPAPIARGPAFVDNDANVRFLKPRHDKFFSGFMLDEQMQKRRRGARSASSWWICARSAACTPCECPEWLDDVVVLPDVLCRMELGLEPGQIERTISVGDEQPR